MSAMGWALLAQLVHIDVWLRTAGADAASPITFAVVLALTCAFAVAIARASTRVVTARVAISAHDERDAVTPSPHRVNRPVTAGEPTGARGPRAPAVAPVG